MIDLNKECNNIPHYTESIFYELKQTARVMKIFASQLFESLKIGLSPDEYSALDTIMCNPGICQRDLAKLLLKDRSNTGRIINTLESFGLINRNLDTKNNRLVKNVFITQKGYDKLIEINDKILCHFKDISKKSPPEEVEAIRLSLQRLRENLEENIDHRI